MEETAETRFGIMANLTISALNRACRDPSCWEEPAVYRALLVCGLSVLTFSAELITKELTLN